MDIYTSKVTPPKENTVLLIQKLNSDDYTLSFANQDTYLLKSSVD